MLPANGGLWLLAPSIRLGRRSLGPKMPADPSPHDCALHSPANGAATRLAGWTLFLSVLALAPIFAFRYPGLQDYPNHLARAFILLHPSDPILQRSYSIQWTTLPNLGWDLWAIGVGRFLPLEWTGKLFLAMSSASILIGCFALNRALQGKWTFAPLLAVPFLFNAGFTKGFLGFNLGIGCALIALACWISIGEKHWRGRLLVATLFSTLLYVIHFYAWAFYGLCVFGRELQVILAAKKPRPIWSYLLRLGRDGLQAIPALAMLAIAARSTAPQLTFTEFYPPYLRIAQIARLIDIGDVVASGALVVVVAFLALLMWRRGWLHLRTDFALTLILCIALFFILPEQIAGTYYVSWRILLLALLVAIASLSPSNEAELCLNRIMSAVALVTLVIVGVQIWSWRNSETGRQAFLALIRDVPMGSALFVVHDGMTPLQLARYAGGLYHVGAYAVLTKRALVQSMFVLPGQQPLRFRDPELQSIPGQTFPFLADIAKRFKDTGLDFRAYVQRFDFVVVHGPNDSHDLQLLPADILMPIDSVADFRLYRVTKKIACAS
jgi:hypothetical protein